ncbi:MAG: type II and III secretion system protein [Proteobacteria bacterium]|nr:type II and III secretion system protein [Pseudomonadota bacterium]
MKKITPKTLLAALCCLSMAAFGTAVAQVPSDVTSAIVPEMTLSVGEQIVLDAQDVASFSESTRGVIEVKVPKDGRRMVVNAQSPGKMTLLLIMRTGETRNIEITVFAKDPQVIIEELTDLLSEQSGLRLKRMGARVFIDGYAESESELWRVQRIAELYPGQVLCLATVGRSVRPRTNIRLDLTFVEFHQSAQDGGGIRWPGQLGATGTMEMNMDLLSGRSTASYRIVDQAFPVIEAAAAHGKVKILKRASLFTTSGNRADYNSGGEVNVPIAGSQAAELRTVSYGCRLSVLPLLDGANGLVDLEVEAEVSELKETGQSVPGRAISRVSTLVHLGLGQSIVLSGLDSHVESRSKNGLPFMSRVPVLGLLFGTHHRRSEQVEGIIAITPVVVDHVEGESRRRIDEALERFRKTRM